LRELALQDASFFSPDEEPASVAGMIAGYFQASLPARLAMRARMSFRWEAIYRRHIAPLLR
jgi:hypothetical protein